MVPSSRCTISGVVRLVEGRDFDVDRLATVTNQHFCVRIIRSAGAPEEREEACTTRHASGLCALCA
jgi:hypothetical protein